MNTGVEVGPTDQTPMDDVDLDFLLSFFLGRCARARRTELPVVSGITIMMAAHADPVFRIIAALQGHDVRSLSSVLPGDATRHDRPA